MDIALALDTGDGDNTASFFPATRQNRMDDIYQEAAAREYQRVLADFSTEKKARNALQKSLARHTELIASSIAAAATKPACRQGCSFCCHYKVEVRAHEVFHIKDFMAQQLSSATQASIHAELEANALQIRSLSPAEHLSTNIKCPFLIDQACSIYPVRPFRCRNFHSTDAQRCETSFNDPQNMDITHDLIESVALFGNAHTQAFEAAAAHSGVDARAYDFTTALLEALKEPKAIKRYRKGKAAFVTALVVDENNEGGQ
jgi:Fe-S-cluster containining protein